MGMSELTFNGNDHTITLRDRNGQVVGTWEANNRTASTATLPYVRNGNYQVQDRHQPHTHGAREDTADGEYGSHGIIRFNVNGHDGVGIHSGRNNTPDRTPQQGTGTDHVTNGCIRTTDEAMRAISETMQQDPLLTVHVEHNRNQR
jgi:hypothetical protein